MALAAYLTQTRRLLQNPAAPTSLYSDADLTSYINIARVQVAGEGQCLRGLGEVTVVGGQGSFFVDAFDVSAAFSGQVGLKAPLAINFISVLQTEKQAQRVSWEYFYQFYRWAGAGSPPAQVWSQQGSGPQGIVFIWPVASNSITLEGDCICYPIPLADDTTAEALTVLWTDAVPYLAAYYALLSSQTGQRSAQADQMYERYEEFMGRARRAATMQVLPFQTEQSGIKLPPVPAGVSGGQQK